MRTSPKIAIVGAGLAGLTCSRELVRRGFESLIFDKGRGLGGRLSTRRTTGGHQFDHGAQYLRARQDGFSSLLHQAEAAGAVARWTPDGEAPAFIGVPGMTGFAKYLARDLNVRTGTGIMRIIEAGGRWRLEWDGGTDVFDRVVVTAPAGQTTALLPEDHPFAAPLASVGMTPCLALMVALPANESLGFSTHREPDGEISWIALECIKPDRPKATCLVAHASPDWSSSHLDLGMDEVAQRILSHMRSGPRCRRISLTLRRIVGGMRLFPNRSGSRFFLTRDYSRVAIGV